MPQEIWILLHNLRTLGESTSKADGGGDLDNRTKLRDNKDMQYFLHVNLWTGNPTHSTFSS